MGGKIISRGLVAPISRGLVAPISRGLVAPSPKDIRTVLEFYRALGFERLPVDIPVGMKTGTAEKTRALKALRSEIGDCTRCKLHKGRKNIVFGEGSPDAPIMFIGEGPGREEDIEGKPFVGDAGKLLTSLINKMGFKREDVYIGNIVKCRPPGNRDPEEDEISTCMPFIKKQIGLIAPKAIVSLGRISAQALIGTKTPISKLRGRFYDYGGIPLMPTFHPAYLLRSSKDKRLADKLLVWEDAQKALERIR